MDGIKFYDTSCTCCPHDEVFTLHTSTEIVLHKICKLILEEEEGSTIISRQMLLFNHYFGLSKGQLIVTDVHFVTIIIEYLSERLKDIPIYLSPLQNFLYICRNSPIIRKTSDLLIDSMEDLINYYNSLGNCLILLEGEEELQLRLINIIENLYANNADFENQIPFGIRKDALECSSLPESLMNFLLIAPAELCCKTLYVIHKITVYSVSCSQRLLQIGFFNQSILFNLEIKNGRIKDKLQKELILNILWNLLECDNTNAFSNAMPKVVLSTLGSWLRYEILNGRSASRNDILSLLCKVIFTCENLKPNESSIFEDLVLLCALTEFNIPDTWASKVRFEGTREDLQFKKILLTILAYMLKDFYSVLIGSEYYILQNISVLLDPHYQFLKTKWTIPQKWELLIYALNVLPFIAPQFPNEYIKSGITGRILFLIEYFSTKKARTELVCNCLKTLHLLLIKEFVSIDHFRQLHAFKIIIRLIKITLFKSMSTLCQIVLSYSFCILSELCMDDGIDLRCWPHLLLIIKHILQRILTPEETDYKFDESLVIATGSFLWIYIANSEEIRRLSIQKGIIYHILDIIEVSSFPIQLLYTGLLADIAEDSYSIVPMVTWRGKSEDITILPLLCNLWRSQEKIKGVKRGDFGSVIDIEEVLKGSNQKMSKQDIAICPPLIEMYGCIRPKIYAIITALLRTHYETALKAVNIYGIQLTNVNFKDKITLKVIQYYEQIKKGEIWENMLKVVKGTRNNGILPMIINYLEMLVAKYYSWGVDIQMSQYFLIRDDVLKMKNKEEILYDKLKSCLQEREIKYLDYVRYNLCTSNIEALHFFKEKYLKLFEEQRKIQDPQQEHPKTHLTHDLHVYFNLGTSARKPMIDSIQF